MKKYFNSIVVLCAVLLSAYMTPNQNVRASEIYLYWYYYDPGFDALVGQIGFGLKSHAEAVFATGCGDYYLSPVECARGYETEQDPFEFFPALGDDRVRDDWDR